MQNRPHRPETTESRDTFDDETMRRILKETAEDVTPAGPAVFSRISKSVGLPKKTEKSRWIFMDRLRDFFVQPQFAWGFAAMQTIVLCLFLVYSPHKQQTYEVLSASRIETASSGPSFHIIFNNSARMIEIEALLQQTGAMIINGPGKRGIYTMKLKKKQSDNIKARLEILKQSSLVSFIEQAY
ncbi:hypothetical protein [Desulfomarina sp.]